MCPGRNTRVPLSLRRLRGPGPSCGQQGFGGGMSTRHVEVLLSTGEEGADIRIRNARPEDARRIQVLYGEVYGPNYSLPLIYDRERVKEAIENDNFFWLVGEHNGRIIGSLLYQIDRPQRMAKALGAVVSRDYRKHNLANTMMKIIQDKITKEESLVDAVYATTRTITTAPQQMTENLGFIPLGIFPNAHKVFEHETHCLAGYFVKEAWKLRRTPVKIIEEVLPFFELARKELAVKDLPLGTPRVFKASKKQKLASAASVKQSAIIPFEIIQSPKFVAARAAQLGNSGIFANTYVPFHQPNLMLVSHDQKHEIYLHYGEKDKYTMIVGGRTEAKDRSLMLQSVAHALRQLNVSYIELLVDAYSPELQWSALNARFLPSAYFPAIMKAGNKRWDYVVFSRSFDMLDFRNVNITESYGNFLQAYLKLWRELYVEAAFNKDNK